MTITEALKRIDELERENERYKAIVECEGDEVMEEIADLKSGMKRIKELEEEIEMM